MAVDPAIQQAIIAYMSGTGGDPFLDSYDTAGAYPWTIDPVESTKEQNDRLTAIGKATDRSMDPGFILGLGDSMGGYGPEAFEPVAVPTPINATGRMMLNSWLSSGDILRRTIAQAVAADPTASPLTIQQDIMEAAMNPGDDPTAQEIAAAIPPRIDQQTGVVSNNTPNWDGLVSEITTLTTALSQDDPRAAEWDGQTVDPETGQPAVISYEDSEAMEALRRAGYSHTPYENYNPDLLAPGGPQQADAQRQQVAGVQQAQTVGANEASKIDTLLGKSLRTQEDLLGAGGNIRTGAAPMLQGQALLEQLRRDGMTAGGPEAPGRFANNPGQMYGGIPGHMRTGTSGGGGNSDAQSWVNRMLPKFNESMRGQRVATGRAQPNEQAAMLRRQLDQEKAALAQARRQFQQGRPSILQQGAAHQNSQELAGRDRYVQDMGNAGMRPFNARRDAMMRNIWGV